VLCAGPAVCEGVYPAAARRESSVELTQPTMYASVVLPSFATLATPDKHLRAQAWTGEFGVPRAPRNKPSHGRQASKSGWHLSLRAKISLLPLVPLLLPDFIAVPPVAHTFRTLQNVSKTASNPFLSNLTASAPVAHTFRTLRNVSKTALCPAFVRLHRLRDRRVSLNV
jgi:hypothetical protein